MTYFCDKKDMFGKPREGNHKMRIPILDVAAVDVIATIVAGLIISKIFGCALMTVLIILFIIAIIAHRVFCVRTRVDKLLFKD